MSVVSLQQDSYYCVTARTKKAAQKKLGGKEVDDVSGVGQFDACARENIPCSVSSVQTVPLSSDRVLADASGFDRKSSLGI